LQLTKPALCTNFRLRTQGILLQSMLVICGQHPALSASNPTGIKMIYPEIDTAVVEAAREEHAKRHASAEQTRITIKNLEASLKTCSEERARHIALAAAGEDTSAEAEAELENATRHNEESLRRQREILGLQNANISAAQKDLSAAPGQAHRARVVFAIRELHDAGHAAAAARHALREAEQRDATARKAIIDAFGAGFPAQMPLRPHQGSIWLGYQIPTATDAAALRATWGELAAEALGEPTAAA